MAASDGQVQQAFDELKRLTGTRAAPQLTAAATALDQFRATTKQVIALSRRNSDVRSLDLSLGKKSMVAAASDAQLRALEEALATRSLGGTR